MPGGPCGAQRVEKGIWRQSVANLATLLFQIGCELSAACSSIKVCSDWQDGRTGNRRPAGQFRCSGGPAMSWRPHEDDVAFHAGRNRIAGDDALQTGRDRILWRVARNRILISALMSDPIRKALGGAMP